jgi:hypothetical protein
MAKYTMEMVLEYAKIFPENADMGSPDGSKAAKAIHDKGGQYIVNAYFTSEGQIEQLLKDGMNPTPMNSPRVLEGNADFGIGKFMKLKRPVPNNFKTFENKNGPVEINYGGPIGVVNLTNFPRPDNWDFMSDSEKSKAIAEATFDKGWWSVQEDGLIGNGTKAMVQFEMYADGSGLRPVNIGITEHVPFEGNNSNYDASANEMFKVA